MDKLNRFSDDVARALFEALPWMRVHARVEAREGGEGGVLMIQLSPPPVREHCDFWMSTENDEVTVGFGMFHTHFEWPAPVDNPFWESPVKFICELVADRILIEDWSRRGEWSRSSILHQEERPNLSSMQPEDVVTIRSWSGAHDERFSGTAG